MCPEFVVLVLVLVLLDVMVVAVVVIMEGIAAVIKAELIVTSMRTRVRCVRI